MVIPSTEKGILETEDIQKTHRWRECAMSAFAYIRFKKKLKIIWDQF